MATTIGAKIQLSGEKEFNQNIKNINANLKLLDSELKLASSQFAENAKSQEALTKKQELLNKKIEEQKTKVSAIEKALEKANEKYKRSANAVEKYKKELEEAKNSENASAEEIKKIESKLENSQKAYDNAVNSVKKYQTQLNNANADLKNFQTELNNTEAEIKSNTDTFNNLTQRLSEVSQKLKDVGSSISSAGKGLTIGVTTPIIAGLGASVKSGMSYESALSQVQATMALEKNSEDMQKIKDKSAELGENTVFSASQAAEAFNYLALAGQNADQAIKSIPNTLNLALAGGLDLASATDMVTDAQSALGLSIDETADFVDKLAKTSQKSNTNIAQLGEGILTVGGTAKNLKGGVTELATSLGILADNGIKGAEGGTILRNVILSLTAGTDVTKKAIQDLGLQVFDSFGNMRGLNEIFTDLNGILSSMTDEQRVNALNAVFNKVDLKGVEGLLANATARYDELSGAIANSDGAAQQMASTMSDNFEGKIKSLQSKLESLQNEAFEMLLPKLNELADAVMNFLNWLQSLNDSTKEMVIDFSLVAAAIGPVLMALGSLANVAADVVIVFENTAAITEFLTAMGSITTVVTGFMATFAPFITAGSVMLSVLKETADAINDVTQKAEEAKNSVSSAYAKIINDAEETAKAFEETKNSVNQANLAYEEQARKSEITASNAQTLVKRLEELEKQSKLTEEQQKEQAAVVTQLNALYPDLNIEIDNETDKLKTNTAEIRNNIKALQDHARQKSYTSKLEELTDKQVDYETQLEDINKQKSDLKKQIEEKEKQDKYDKKLIEDYQRRATEIDEETGELSYKYTEEQYKAAKYRVEGSELSKLKKALSDAEATSRSLETEIKKNQSNIDKISEKMVEPPKADTSNSNVGMKEWLSGKADSKEWINKRNQLNDWEAFGTTEVESIQRMINTLNEEYKNGNIGYNDYINEKKALDKELTESIARTDEEKARILAKKIAKEEKERKAQKKAEKELLKEQEEAEKKRQEALKTNWGYQKNLSLEWIKKRNELGDWEAQGTTEADSYQRMLKKLQELYKQGYVDYDTYLNDKRELKEKYDAVYVDPNEGKNSYNEEQERSRQWIEYRNYYKDYSDYNTTEGDSVGRMIQRAGDAYQKGVLDYEEYKKEIEKLTSDMTDKEMEYYDKVFSYLREQHLKGILAEKEFYDSINAVTFQSYKARKKMEKETKEQQIKDVETEWDKKLKAAKKSIDETKSAFDKRIKDLQNQYASEDRAADLNELYEEAENYKKSVTISGQEHYEDIQNQIKQLEREQEIADLQEEQNAIIESMEAEYQQMEEQKATILEEMNNSQLEYQTTMKDLGISVLSALNTLADTFKGVVNNNKQVTYNYINNNDNGTRNNTYNNTYNNKINDNVDMDIFNRTFNPDRLNY